jgi:hypothetical protein
MLAGNFHFIIEIVTTLLRSRYFESLVIVSYSTFNIFMLQNSPTPWNNYRNLRWATQNKSFSSTKWFNARGHESWPYDLVLFGGGDGSNRVNIYDLTSGKWH